MKQITGLTALVLLSILFCTAGALSAKDSIEIELKDLRTLPEIDLKELRSSTADPARLPASRKNKMPDSKSDRRDSSNTASSYVVKPGDNLFKILMLHYGLSNDAAERLIPEIMRLNNISNIKGLTVGQKLTIQLIPLPVDKQKVARIKTSKGAPFTPQTDEGVPQPARKTGNQTPPEPDFRLRIPESPSCTFARAVIVQLGLLAERTGSQPEIGFAAVNSELKLVVACNLSPEESITYGRLLSMHKTSLIVFKGDESPEHVIEELASRFKLSFHIENTSDSGALTEIYVFPAKAPYDKDVRITINSAGGGNESELR